LETSAKTAINVDAAFLTMAKELIKSRGAPKDTNGSGKPGGVKLTPAKAGKDGKSGTGCAGTCK